MHIYIYIYIVFKSPLHPKQKQDFIIYINIYVTEASKATNYIQFLKFIKNSN